MYTSSLNKDAVLGITLYFRHKKNMKKVLDIYFYFKNFLGLVGSGLENILMVRKTNQRWLEKPKLPTFGVAAMKLQFF